MKRRAARSLHHAFAAVDSLHRRFLTRPAILAWCIRVAIIWVVSLPLALRAIRVLERLQSAAPPALVAYFFALVIAKASLLVLLGRALDRTQARPVQLQA